MKDVLFYELSPDETVAAERYSRQMNNLTDEIEQKRFYCTTMSDCMLLLLSEPFFIQTGKFSHTWRIYPTWRLRIITHSDAILAAFSRESSFATVVEFSAEHHLATYAFSTVALSRKSSFATVVKFLAEHHPAVYTFSTCLLSGRHLSQHIKSKLRKRNVLCMTDDVHNLQQTQTKNCTSSRISFFSMKIWIIWIMNLEDAIRIKI